MDAYFSQVICGAVLGGSSLVVLPRSKNYCLSMRNAVGFEQEGIKWLTWKMKSCGPIFDNKIIYKDKKTLRTISKTSSFLTDLYPKFYKDRERFINPEILESLRDVAIAVWFLDDGGKIGRNKKNAYLNTKKHGKSSSKLIEIYFNSLDLDCKLNTQDRLIFSVESTISLFKIIAHRFPDFMHHKL